MRKIDIRVIPALCMMFAFTSLDRANTGQELALIANQYNVVLTVL